MNGDQRLTAIASEISLLARWQADPERKAGNGLSAGSGAAAIAPGHQ